MEVTLEIMDFCFHFTAKVAISSKKFYSCNSSGINLPKWTSYHQINYFYHVLINLAKKFHSTWNGSR